jgi:hypothetical protein
MLALVKGSEHFLIPFMRLDHEKTKYRWIAGSSS